MIFLLILKISNQRKAKSNEEDNSWYGSRGYDVRRCRAQGGHREHARSCEAPSQPRVQQGACEVHRLRLQVEAREDAGRGQGHRRGGQEAPGRPHEPHVIGKRQVRCAEEDG